MCVRVLGCRQYRAVFAKEPYIGRCEEEGKRRRRVRKTREGRGQGGGAEEEGIRDCEIFGTCVSVYSMYVQVNRTSSR